MKKNQILPILGAILGAIIFSIPWVLIYVYGGYILSILGATIAYGSLKFYKMFGGVPSKSTPYIIAISSIASMTLATLVIIPLLEVAKEGYGISFELVKYLYNTEEFLTAIITDYIVSIIFTILGISGIIAKLKKEVSTKEN
ncbi:MAG: hypothetical protein Q4C23_03250 [Mycoplasmatota bacterium]|nr:hypothetical protein [Mycoplasmatota bacterium]